MPFDEERDYSRLQELEGDAGWREFLRNLDNTLMTEIRSLPGVWQWYDFFDSPDKPLNPREFLHFWGSLSYEEDFVYKLFTPADILRGK